MDKIGAFLLSIGFLFAARPALAQSVAPRGSVQVDAGKQPGSPEATAPSSQTAPVTSAEVSPATAAPAPSECQPACRRNYVCIDRQCVSSCNPPCDSDEMCFSGECVAKPRRDPEFHEASSTPTLPGEAVPEPTTDEAVNAAEPELKDKKGRKRRSAPYTHDGLYLRLGVGLGSLSGTLSAGEGSSADISGTPAQIDFGIGGVTSPGLVLGGGVFASISGAPSYSENANGQSVKVDGGTLATVVLGPFLDYYFNPKRGFHLEIAVGPAFVSASTGDPQTVCVSGGCGPVTMKSYSGTGLGAVVGIGYEAWVAPQASFGGLFRLMCVSSGITLEGSSNSDLTLTEVVPAVLATLTTN